MRDCVWLEGVTSLFTWEDPDVSIWPGRGAALDILNAAILSWIEVQR